MATASAEDAARVLEALEHARLVAQLYADAEAELFTKIADRLQERLGEPEYEGARFAEIRELRREAERIVGRLERAAAKAVRSGVTDAWRRGVDAALEDLRGLGSKKLISPGQGVDVLVGQTLNLVTQVQAGALRAVEDIYRQVIARTVGLSLTGALTRREATQRALDRFADRGITGFVDRAGRHWDMPSYTEMAMRTAMTRATVDGHLAAMSENDIDLVLVSRTPHGCPLCDPWEGEVLSISGPAGTRTEPHATRDDETVKVKVAATVAEARAAGLLHPNCRHNLNAYLPGVTRPAPPVEASGTYEDTQEQRRLERQVRHWKRREAAALDDDARAKADVKVEEYQARLRELTKATGLRRRSGREQIGVPRPPRPKQPPAPRQRPERPEQPKVEPAEPSTSSRPPGVPEHWPVTLRGLPEEDLLAFMQWYTDDPDMQERFLTYLDELEQREAREDADPGWAWSWEEDETPEDRRITELVADGMPYLDAYAEVHGLDAGELRRQEELSLLRQERETGETLDAMVRRLYAEWLDMQVVEAENATRGVLLNKAGQAADIDPRTLFSGRADRARRYASEELLRWWGDHPRMTLTEFKAQMLERDSDRRAARRIREGSAGREFGV
ncbi:hypothetical protein GCM10010466_39950 [Planomonospora alba]|uniref:Uncharacterized protein n=1 Tax=Planomonospora alba TaxID=161354 RepID=A0ABP6NG01_9ACTN